ncbi:E3 ubiquitin-protein ligase ZNRF4 [Aegotheles albertisi]
MAARPPLGRAHAASLALGPQRLQAEAPHAQRGGHKVTTYSPCYEDVTLGNGEMKGGPIAAFIMEVKRRLWRKSCRAERGPMCLLDTCCFWNDTVWSFSHRACRYLIQDLNLLYYGLLLPLCKVTVITGIQLLAGCMKGYQSLRESREQWSESPPSMVWRVADHPECAICLQEYKPGEGLKLLSCSHAYHSKCIDLWHRAQPGSRTCPLCLRSVTAVSLILLGTQTFGYVAYNDNSSCVVYKALPACFGPPLMAEGLMGCLMKVTPPNACHAIRNPPAPRNASKTHIALIQGCDCSCVKKVLHAQQAGYQAAVVYNDSSEQLTTMMADDREIQQLIKIPSLFTGLSVSHHLKRTLQCKTRTYRLLPPKHYLRLCKGSAKMLQEVFMAWDFRNIFYIITATISVMVGLNWYNRPCKITLHTYKQGDKYETCVICMAEYKEGDCLQILSCSHAYHSACIKTWFQIQSRKKTCPVCKQVVNTCGQGEVLPEKADEDANEEEQDEDNAFREGTED